MRSPRVPWPGAPAGRRSAARQLLAVFVALSVSAGAGWAFDLSDAGKLVDKVFGRKSAESQKKSGESQKNRPARPAAGERLARDAGDPGTVPSQVAETADGAEADSSATTEVSDQVLLTPEPYAYQSIGRRDPFVSLVGEEYLADHAEENANLGDLSVVGILWGDGDRYALVENGSGGSFILREGDRLGSYAVSRIEPDAVWVYSSEFGVGRTERLALTGQKGNRNARDDR